MYGLPDSMIAVALVFLVVLFFSFLGLSGCFDCPPRVDDTETPDPPKVNPYAIQQNGHGKFRVAYIHTGGKQDERRVCDTREQAEAYMAECIYSDSVNAAARELNEWRSAAEKTKAAKEADPSRHGI